jgi:hypothetical protein
VSLNPSHGFEPYRSKVRENDSQISKYPIQDSAQKSKC